MADGNWKEMFDFILKKQGNTFISFLIDAGLDVNALNKFGKTMLSYAAEWGNLEITQILVENGANGNVVNSDGSKPLHIAAQYGREDIVKYFVGRGVSADSCDNDKCTPLHYVARCDGRCRSRCGCRSRCTCRSRQSYIDIVHFLVNSNANLNAVNGKGHTPLIVAGQYFQKHFVELFIKLGANIGCRDENQYTILHLSSCLNSWLEVVRFLVEGKFDLDLNARNREGYTPLLLAAQHSCKDIVELLIKLGANVSCSNIAQSTLLHFCSSNGWLDIVKYLVNIGCDVNAKDDRGCTPVVIAAYLSHLSIVEYLLMECGANHEDHPFGMTLLHYACEAKWLEVVKFLITKGSDLNAQDDFKETPLHCAMRACNSEIITDLLEAGADWNLKCNEGTTAFNRSILHISFFSDASLFTLFLENGAYFQSSDYNALKKVSHLKDSILQDVRLCTQAVINQFNNAELPRIYKISVVAEKLPTIDKLKIKIASHKTVIRHIAECVNSEIQTKGYCDVLNVRPIVLSSICLGSLFKHYSI